MEKSADRMQVVDNIKELVKENKLNDKVEIGDHKITDEERKKYILHFDNKRKGPIRAFKKVIARNIANDYTRLFNKDTEIIGIENVKGIKTGAIITSNHFSVQDSTIIRFFTNKVGKRNHLDIIIEEENIFMKGQFGFLMNNCSTIPVSQSKEYTNNNFMPAIQYLLKKKDYILIYPEEQMWFNYKKPRTVKIGAYHIAAKFNVPVISCFVEMKEKEEVGDNGFKKVKYILHILPTIYPDPEKDLKTNKEEMRKKDYEQKVEAYEKYYGKKLDYNFEEWDIAGLL